MADGVIDTSVLVGFSGIDRLDVLCAVFPSLAVVPAVYAEVVTQGEGWAAARPAQQAIVEGEHLVRVGFSEGEDPGQEGDVLGRGEMEVIRYALIRDIPALIDDGLARKTAFRVGVREVFGSLGILAKAKRIGYIQAVHPLSRSFRHRGFIWERGWLRDFCGR